MKRSCSRRWRDKWAGHAGLRPISDIRGAAAVEFALIILSLMLLLLGTVDGGRMLWTQNTLQYAVEQAARCAVVNTTTCGTPAQIQSYAVSMANGMSLSSSVFSSSSPACGTQVSASYSYTPLFPYPTHVILTARSCRPI
ncbi:MAG: TadE family protein [Methylocella sp.]